MRMPTREEQNNFYHQIGRTLDGLLKDQFEQEMGFALLVFGFGKQYNYQGGDYVSNAKRDDMIKALRDTADRIEKGEVIPNTIGEA